MARITSALTNTEILKAKAYEKNFTLRDGDGLFLLLKKSGASVTNIRQAVAESL